MRALARKRRADQPEGSQVGVKRDLGKDEQVEVQPKRMSGSVYKGDGVRFIRKENRGRMERSTVTPSERKSHLSRREGLVVYPTQVWLQAGWE